VTFLASGGRGSPSKAKLKLPHKPIKIRWDASKTVAANAGEKLPELARSFFSMGSAAATENASLQALHRFRLSTKRFRYVLELFRPCYGPGLGRRISELQTLQQRLGDISDCAATAELLRKRADLSRAERSLLVRRLRELAAVRVYRFQRQWQAEFAPPQVERRWTDYLARYAGARRRR
jgi:CHAD domain-containing protein